MLLVKKSITIFSMIVSLSSVGQELIPDPGFEINESCRDGKMSMVSSIERFSANWTAAGIGTSPDLFSECNNDVDDRFGIPDNYFGSMNASKGKAYAGFYAFAENGQREYLKIQLSDSLSAGDSYTLKFSLSLAGKKSSLSVDRIGAFFHDRDIRFPEKRFAGSFGIIPQVETEKGVFCTDSVWTQFSVDYVARGGERYLILGNFYDFLEEYELVEDSIEKECYSYMFMDDISLIRNERHALGAR